jgi:hypothetical protein
MHHNRLGNIINNTFLIRYFFPLILKQVKLKKHLYLLEKQCPKLTDITCDNGMISHVLWMRNADITLQINKLNKIFN